MDNMTYEAFIRRCWHCDRFKHGANTDTWEDLLIKHYDYKNANKFHVSLPEKVFFKKLAQIKDYLDKAFNKLISNATKKKVAPNVVDNLIHYRDLVQKSNDPTEIWTTLNLIFPIINAYSL